LFAREQSNLIDWEYWGDEVDRFDTDGKVVDKETLKQQREVTRRQQIQLANQISKNKTQSTCSSPREFCGELNPV
jgi:hypothetical protein